MDLQSFFSVTTLMSSNKPKTGKVVTLNAITASPVEIESALHPVTGLNLKILINNVGVY